MAAKLSLIGLLASADRVRWCALDELPASTQWRCLRAMAVVGGRCYTTVIQLTSTLSGCHSVDCLGLEPAKPASSIGTARTRRVKGHEVSRPRVAHWARYPLSSDLWDDTNQDSLRLRYCHPRSYPPRYSEMCRLTASMFAVYSMGDY